MTTEPETIYEDRRGQIWIGTYKGGVNLLDRGDDSFRRFQHDPANPYSLSHDRVSSVLQDRGGVMWVGTQAGGINRWDPRTWSFSSVAVRPAALSGRDTTAVPSTTAVGKRSPSTMRRSAQVWKRWSERSVGCTARATLW